MVKNKPKFTKQHYFYGDNVESINGERSGQGTIIGTRKNKYGRISYDIQISNELIVKDVLYENIVPIIDKFIDEDDRVTYETNRTRFLEKIVNRNCKPF